MANLSLSLAEEDQNNEEKCEIQAISCIKRHDGILDARICQRRRWCGRIVPRDETADGGSIRPRVRGRPLGPMAVSEMRWREDLILSSVNNAAARTTRCGLAPSACDYSTPRARRGGCMNRGFRSLGLPGAARWTSGRDTHTAPSAQVRPARGGDFASHYARRHAMVVPPCLGLQARVVSLCPFYAPPAK